MYMYIVVVEKFCSTYWHVTDIQIQTTSQSSPMQAYNQAINDLDKELDHLKQAFEVIFVHVKANIVIF